MEKNKKPKEVIQNAALLRLDEKNVQIQKLEKELKEKNDRITLLEKLLYIDYARIIK